METDENCIFCKIVAGTIPAQKTYEDENVVAFLDINPKVPGHTILIPKAHYEWFQDLPDEVSDPLFRISKTLAKQLKTERSADYVHLSIVGRDVPHVHLHLMPRKLHEQLPAV